jgi:hypothetical protein
MVQNLNQQFIIIHLVNKCAVMEPESCLLCSQKPVIGPVDSNPHQHPTSLRCFNIIFPSVRQLLKSLQQFVCIPCFSVRLFHVSPYSFFFYLISITVLSEGYKL